MQVTRLYTYSCRLIKLLLLHPPPPPPPPRKLLGDNYDSLTKRHYVGYKGADGSEPLPANTHPNSSGFAHNLPRTTPTSKLVSQAYDCTCIMICVSLNVYTCTIIHWNWSSNVWFDQCLGSQCACGHRPQLHPAGLPQALPAAARPAAQ